MKRYLIILSFFATMLFSSSSVFGQTYNMPGGTINTCSGNFYDGGGSAANYLDNQNVTTTFCSNAGSCVRVTFSSFNTENTYDYLYIYDGPTTASPQIAGSPFTGATSPGTVTSTTGCLTFRFTSDGSVTAAGWAAVISCVACPAAAWKDAWVSMNTGAATWCVGETRNVTVTVTNTGTSTWSNASPDINIGCKWNAEADYFVRVNANGLAPGATTIYTLTMTAPSAGANNLTFDVVNEGDCWFGNNNGSCGPGNVVYTSAAITITTCPCSSVISIGGCGSGFAQSYTGGGAGVWNTNFCGFSTPGIEQVYSFVAPTTGIYSIQATAASGYVDYGWLASSCASGGWTCIDDINTTGTWGSMSWTAGTTYYILLDDEDATTGTHTFYINCPAAAPANDNCAGAIALTVNTSCVNTAGTSANATASGFQNTCAGGGTADDDVWYKFVATATTATITVAPNASYDAAFELRSGACSGSLVAGSCTDGPANGGAETYNASGLTVSATYYIRVWDYNSGSGGGGSFDICVVGPCTVGSTNTWDGSSSTAWNTAANWSLNVVPIACDNVIIPNVANDPIVSGAVTVNNLTIQNGGILQTDAAITVNGTFTIDNGGTYKHNNTANPKATVFNGTESFGASSTFEILNWPNMSYYIHNGSTVEGDPMHSTPFGNLTLNWDAGGFQWEWKGYLTNASNPRIAGTLDIQYIGSNDVHITGNGNETHQVGALKVGSGGGRIVFKAQSDGYVTSWGPTTLNILGDMTVEGGNFWLDEDGETSAAYVNTVNIYGNYIQTGGTFDMCYGADNYTDAIHVVNLYGNYTQTGGTIESSHTGTGFSTYYMEWHFAKAGIQTYSNTSAAADKGLGQLVYHIVNAGSTLQLTTDFACQTLDNNNQTLWIFGTVDAGGYRIYPNYTSNFTYYFHGVYMASGSRLRTTNVNGFFTNGSATTTVFDNANNTPSFLFDANSTIEYNGSAQQILTNGGGLPLNYAILDVYNTTAGGSALTMTSGNVNCEQLRLRDGVVSTGTNTLTVLNTAVTAIQNHTWNGSYVNTGASGQLRRYVTATGSYDYPVGNGNTNSYQLMNLNITSGNTATYIDVNFDNPANATGTGFPLVDATYQYDAVLNNGGTAAATGNANGGVWTVTPNSGTANYSMSLYGRNHSNQGSLRNTILKRTTAGPGAWTIPGTYSSSTLTTPITAVRTAYSGFSQFAIGRSDVALPVELLSFSGKCDNDKTILNWSTASETNNNFFTVERSADAQWFSVLGTVPGAGNSSTIKNYSLTDSDPLKGKTFYRLSQTDFNGTKETFAPISVSCDEENNFDVTVNSNPVTDGTIYLSVSAVEGSKIILVLTDILGRDIHSESIASPGGNFIVTINPDQKLAQGMYFITASNKDKYISRKIIVK